MSKRFAVKRQPYIPYRSVLLMLFVLISLPVGLAACGGFVASPTALQPITPSTLEPGTLPAPTVSPNPDQAREALLNAFRASFSQSYKSVSTVQLEEGQIITTTVEYAPPDRYHIVSDKVEMIVSGGKVHIQEGGVWKLSALDPSQIVTENLADAYGETMQDILYLGQETLDDKPMLLYQFQNISQVGEHELVNQFKIWVGEADGLVYQILQEGDILGFDPQTNKTGKSKATTTTTYSYDPSIKIEAPLE